MNEFGLAYVWVARDMKNPINIVVFQTEYLAKEWVAALNSTHHHLDWRIQAYFVHTEV